METKTLHLEVKNAARGEVEAVFSTFNKIDAHRDVTLPGAFTDGAPVVISSYGHTSWEGRLPVGRGVIRAGLTEATLKGQFFMNTTHGADTFHTVEALGELGQWSYGFDVTRESFGDHDGQKVRFLEGLEVYEVSPVLLGAGVNTRTLVTKGAGDRPRDGLDEGTRAWLRNIHDQVTRDQLRAIRADLERQMDYEQGRQALMDAAMKHLAAWYVEVDDHEVPEWKRVVAAAALAKHCKALGHQAAPSLRWFRGEDRAEATYLEVYGEVARKGFGWFGEGRLLGKAVRPVNEVWLDATMHQAADIDAITAHEVRHLTGGDEQQAQAYENTARASYWNMEGL